MTTLAPEGQVYRLMQEPNRFNDYIEIHYSTTLEPLLKKLKAGLKEHMKGELALLQPSDAYSDHERDRIRREAAKR